MTHAPMSLARRARSGAVVVALTAIGTGALGSATAAAATQSPSEVRWGILKSVNETRAEHGCRPLKVAKKLNKAAQGHADDMARTGLFSHVSADGRTWLTRIRATGWKKPGGENIAYGFGTSVTVMNAWMNSPEHRRNILNCGFRFIGVGYNPDGEFAVQDFGY